MGLASSLQKAANVLNKLGGAAVIRYVSPGAYNAATGAASESTTDVSVRGAAEGVSRSEVNGLIEAEDKRLTVPAGSLTTAPTTKDRVVISNVIYQIIQVETEEQDNTPIVYKLFLRS